jgi:hypothetical protein
MTHRLTGTAAGPLPYEWARIISPTSGKHLAGRCVKMHKDGTATISLGDMFPVRGKLVAHLHKGAI